MALVWKWMAGGGGAGTVTSITAGTGLSGGTITTSGTIALNAATSSVLGGVKPDGTTITNTAGAISVTYPLTSAPGTAAYTAATAYDVAGAAASAQAVGYLYAAVHG
jgi:hypothetical protein